jgi:hypothetical protein
MRDLCELSLHASIVSCNEQLCEKTLVFARENTF